MKPIVREHIQQLDVSLGGGIVSEKIRVDTIDNPILIIGLGERGLTRCCVSNIRLTVVSSCHRTRYPRKNGQAGQCGVSGF